MIDLTATKKGKNMKLSEFLSLTRLTSTEIAKEIGIAPQTIWNALKGYEMSLTNALKIEEYTKKAVTCNDLKPTRKRGLSKEVVDHKGNNSCQTHGKSTPE